MDKSCLNCKNYRPEDEFTGRCRVDRKTLAPERYPLMRHTDVCERWQDCGQRYYIRLGWLKRFAEQRKEAQTSQAKKD